MAFLTKKKHQNDIQAEEMANICQYPISTQKHMATLEAQAAERVIEACVRTGSVRKCVFTSSLLACVWRQNNPHGRRCPTIIDESCWSDESFCRDNKVSDWEKA
jgi:hypothetical protein